MKRKVFVSFDYDNDVMRVQQIRNIGALSDDERIITNVWEDVEKKSKTAIQDWIDSKMVGKSCVVVLIGKNTAVSEWVQYEITKGWNDGKGMLGIYIHNINCPRDGKCQKGQNPFDSIPLTDGRKLSAIVKCYDPTPGDAYGDIARNIDLWVEAAISDRVK